MGGGLSPPLTLLLAWAIDRERYPYGARHGHFIIILMGVSLFITLVVIALRLWARCRIRRNAGLDDWLIVAAVPILLGYDACHVLGYFLYGLDRHIWELTTEQAIHSRIITWCIAVSYMLITALTKISILTFYRRLSHGTYTTSWIWTVRGFIAFVAALAVTFAILLCVGCRPFKAFWLRVNIEWVMNNEYTCFNEGVNFIVFAVINVITDAAVCILPLLVLRRLQMPKRQKWALSALFGIGFFLCFCGIMRLVWLYIVYYTTYDLTWTTNYIFSWTLVETHFSIVCASAPALNVFFRRILQATTHRNPNSNPSHQRNVYSTIGSGSAVGGGSRPRLNDDGGESGESGIYMADMIAYKAAKAEAKRRERASSLFSVSEENSKDEGSSRRGSSMTVTHEELDGDRIVSGSEYALPAVEEEQPRSSRGSTDSILETHHVVVGGLGK